MITKEQALRAIAYLDEFGWDGFPESTKGEARDKIRKFIEQAAQAQAVPEHLAKFYQTTEPLEIISIMERQISRLQERIPKDNQQIRTHVREG